MDLGLLCMDLHREEPSVPGPVQWQKLFLIGRPAEDALPLFRQAGLVNTDDDSSALEECWFLSVNVQEATATLAWRVGNSYLSAVDGTWLQTEN